MVDWNRIRELRDEIGEDDHAEVFELFFEEVEDSLARLARAGTPAEREADLHFLKGSALNVGFRALGELCARSERRAAEGALDPAEIEAVVEAYRVSRAEFEAGPAAVG